MKKIKFGSRFLSILAICFFLFLAFGSGDDKKKNADGTPKTERQIQIEKQFDAWDGSHIKLTKVIKQAMNDPKSFEHVDTKYWDLKDHIVVVETYRGKNAFGGVVKNWVKVEVDMDGNVTKVIEEGK